MRYFISILCALFLLLSSCKEETNQAIPEVKTETDVAVDDVLKVKYAKGFQLKKIENGYQLYVSKAWQDHDHVIGYKFINADAPEKEIGIRVPITSIIPTSTTHIPAIDLLNKTETIKGFPGLDYISSTKARQLISDGKIQEIGNNQSLNTESIIKLNPDIVMGFGVDGKNNAYDAVERASIPIIYNGDWLEEHPLGKAEWIKVFGILYGKEKEAAAIFNAIEEDYLDTKIKIAALEKPTVISGAMWKDVWYLPYGNSWQGKIIRDAGGQYIYSNTSGNGSLSYAAERVLKDAKDAQFWIAPGQYTSYEAMLEDSKTYELFDAFKNKEVYTFALTKGEKGGVTYYEEAHMRPDIVLKDLISILHPEVDLDHELYFFKPLEK